MEVFHPSLFLAMFPCLFIGSFPLFGLMLVTKWIANETKKNRARSASPKVGNVPTVVHFEKSTDDMDREKNPFSKVFGGYL